MRTTLVSAALFVGQSLAFALPNPVEDFIGETLELVHLEHLDKRVCPHDNLLRCLIGTPSLAVPFCSSSANVIATTPTVFVTITPTASVTSTSTTLQTVTSTTSVTATQTTSTTITVPPPAVTVTVTYFKKRTTTVSSTEGSSCTSQVIYSKRGAAATSLACLTNLNPSASAVTSACSCFSGSYTPAAVTETLIAPTVTVTPYATGVTQTVTTGITQTVDTLVTVTVTSTSTVSVCSVSLP